MDKRSRRYSLWYTREQEEFKQLERVASGISFVNAARAALCLTGHWTPGRHRSTGTVFLPRPGAIQAGAHVGWHKPAPDLWLLRGPRGMAVIELPALPASQP